MEASAADGLPPVVKSRIRRAQSAADRIAEKIAEAAQMLDLEEFARLDARLKTLTDSFQPCTWEVEFAVKCAHHGALITRTQSITPSHLIVGILSADQSVVVQALQAAGIEYKELAARLHEMINDTRATDRLRSIHEIQFSPSVKNILDARADLVDDVESSRLNTGELLLLICSAVKFEQADAQSIANELALARDQIRLGRFTED